MAKVIVKVKIMPTSPDVDLSTIEADIKAVLDKDESQFHVATKIPIAFGLSSLEVVFLREESKGNTDDIEEAFSKLKGVESVDVIDVRREFG
jgi:elongation factor 1-beta